VSHNAFARPQALWSGISVPTARDLSIWDAYQYKGLNGDAGGIYAPTTPIIIGGAGLVLSGAGNVIEANTQTLSGGRLQLGSNDYVQLNARTRTEVIGLVGALPDQSLTGIGGDANWSNVLSASPLGISPIPTANDFTVPIPSRYLHQGANLTLASLAVRALNPLVGSESSGPYWMFANVIAMNAATTGGASLVPALAARIQSHAYVVGSVVIPNVNDTQTGYYYKATSISGTGTSAAYPLYSWPTTIGSTITDNAGANQIIWTCEGQAGLLSELATGGFIPGTLYNGGNPQVMMMTPPPSGPFTIDCTTYDYLLQVTYDGMGPGSLSSPNWLFHSLSLTYGNIVDMRPE
jgi:hypothetical protein